MKLVLGAGSTRAPREGEGMSGLGNENGRGSCCEQECKERTGGGEGCGKQRRDEKQLGTGVSQAKDRNSE